MNSITSVSVTFSPRRFASASIALRSMSCVSTWLSNPSCFSVSGGRLLPPWAWNICRRWFSSRRNSPAVIAVPSTSATASSSWTAWSCQGTKKAAIVTATIPMIHFSQPRWRRIRSSIVIVKTSWAAGRGLQSARRTPEKNA